MCDHAVDRRADVVTERPPVGEPVDVDLVAVRPRDPEVTGGGADRARGRRELERQLAQRAPRDRIPDLELLALTDDELVALDARHELQGAALEVDGVRCEAAAVRADDRELLPVGRYEDEPARCDRRDVGGHREIDPRGCLELRRVVELHARRGSRARRDDEDVRGPADDREIDIIALERERRDRGRNPTGEQRHVATLTRDSPLAIGAGHQLRAHFLKPRMIFTRASSSSGSFASSGLPGIIGFLPTPAPPLTMMSLI